MTYNRYPRHNRKRLRAVSVARTVEAPQPDFEIFLNDAGSKLGRLATVTAITSTRVTILESNGISRALRLSKADPRAIAEFSYWLSSHLDSYRVHGMDMHVDPDRPLKLMGRNQNTLVLNLLTNEYSQEQRDKAEELLRQRFGELPELKSFDEHVSFAHVHAGRLTEMEKEDPSLLLQGVAIPETVALNGLTVFLDGKALVHG